LPYSAASIVAYDALQAVWLAKNPGEMEKKIEATRRTRASPELREHLARQRAAKRQE